MNNAFTRMMTAVEKPTFTAVVPVSVSYPWLQARANRTRAEKSIELITVAVGQWIFHAGA